MKTKNVSLVLDNTEVMRRVSGGAFLFIFLNIFSPRRFLEGFCAVLQPYEIKQVMSKIDF